MKNGIVAVLSAVAGVIAGASVISRKKSKDIKNAWKYSDKHLSLFLMMNQWVQVKQEGKNLAVYFERCGYTRIAVYGMSYAGETLLNELKNTGIQVLYGMDQNAKDIYADIDMLTIDDTLPSVDAVVVTAITYFDEVKEKLQEKLDCPVISLEDILYEI